MTVTFLVVLSGLALVDALNPFTIAAQTYLLGTPQPMRRSLAFLLGTFATYLAGGVVLLLGWSAFIARVLPLLPTWIVPAAEILLGAATLIFGIWSLRRAATGKPFAPPSDLSVKATLTFALASTLADLSSALPYFGAISQIAAATLPGWAILLALAWYNVLYCSPLIALVIARIALKEEQSDLFFGRMRQAIDWAFAKLLPPLLILVGTGLAVDGFRRVLT